MTYWSKVDVLTVVVGGGLLAAFAYGIYDILHGGAMGWFMAILILAVVFLFGFPVWYRISSSELIIRCGAFRQTIPLEGIEEVYPARDVVSAPAWAIERLHVDFRKGVECDFVRISPQHKGAFLRELASKAPHLQLSEDRLIRVSRAA
jgi:hypothetical protein